MKRNLKLKLLQAVSYCICCLFAWNRFDALEATELSGGTVTGPLLSLLLLGTFLFTLAAVFTFARLRIAAVSGLLAALLSLPISLYFLAPGPFRFVFRGEYSVPLRSNFVWSRWTLIPTFLFVVAILVSFFSLSMTRRGQMQTAKS